MCSFTDSVIQTFPHISWKYLSHRTCSLDKHRAGQGIPADEGGFSSFSSLLCLSGALVAFIEVKMAHFTVEITVRSSKKEHTGTTLKGAAPGALSTPPSWSGRSRTSGPVGKAWLLFPWKPQTRVRPLPKGISLPRDPVLTKALQISALHQRCSSSHLCHVHRMPFLKTIWKQKVVKYQLSEK